MGVGLVASMSVAATIATAEPRLERAKADYLNYCAACHGADGTGNGPPPRAVRRREKDIVECPDRGIGNGTLDGLPQNVCRNG